MAAGIHMPYVETVTPNQGVRMNILSFHMNLPGEPKDDSGIHAFTKARRPGRIQTKRARETYIQRAVA
jgi:hypothetical protein